MTAIADDLCSSNQLRNNSSGDTTAECLQHADYTKHEAKQAMTVAVNNNNNNNISHDVSPGSRSGDEETSRRHGDGRSVNNFVSIRTPSIDLSAITEEGDDLTNTSMYLSCSHEATPSECASTPIDKSQSSHSRHSDHLSSEYSRPLARMPKISDSDLDSAGGVQHLEVSSQNRHHRSFSSPELFSDELNSQSLCLSGGYGEAMCTPTSSQKPTDSSLPQTEMTDSPDASHVTSLSKQMLFGNETLGDCTFDSQRCELPCHPAKASFTLGESPPSSPTTPNTPLTPTTTTTTTDCTSTSQSFELPHVHSDAKLSKRSPAQRKSLAHRIRRSKSYTNTSVASTTPNHARFLQQQMTQLSVDQVFSVLS